GRRARRGPLRLPLDGAAPDRARGRRLQHPWPPRLREGRLPGRGRAPRGDLPERRVHGRGADGPAAAGLGGAAVGRPGRDGGPVTVRRAVPSDAAALAEVAAVTFALACPPSTKPEAIADFIATTLSEASFAAYLADPARTL